MTPGHCTFILYKGSTFHARTLRALKADKITPVNLTGYLAHAKIRETVNGPVIRDLFPTITDGPNGEITIPAITDEVTNSSACPRGNYMWDLLLETSGGVKTGPYLSGPFVISAAVSR